MLQLVIPCLTYIPVFHVVLCSFLHVYVCKYVYDIYVGADAILLSS